MSFLTHFISLKRQAIGIVFSVLALSSSDCASAASVITDPVANPKAVITCGNARFTVLTPQMIRIQYSKKGLFEDRATFGVINRRLPVPQYAQAIKDGYLEIKTSALTLRYKVGSPIDLTRHDSQVLGITLNLNGHDVKWYPGKDDALNLKGTCRTLDGQQGENKRAALENGLISRAGWSVIDESPKTKRGDGSTTFAFDKQVNGISWWAEPVDKDAIDWYFLGYGHEYKKAINDFTKIGGKIPMPPLYMFGYWYSRYKRYTQQDFVDIANDVKANHIPMDVMIIDMDWHLPGWTGWTWDKSVIPDPEGLIRFMHSRNLKVALNLHPADGVDKKEEYFADMVKDMNLPASTTNIPWKLEDSTFYKAMFNDILRKCEAQGIDFWWLDWQQNLTSKYTEGLSETFWCNHVFYNDMRVNRPDRRPVIYHRWGGLGSHRYPIGFSGDAWVTFPSLAFQPYFTATASNVCFGYWGHDLGGHIQKGDNDPELYQRWMQFGVFTPIFKTHATNSEQIERRIWKFPNFKSLLKTVQLRYELVPYIYNAARQAYDTGISICRLLYYEWPEKSEAYDMEDEYYFGDNIIVAPILTRAKADGTSKRRIWLPQGKWYDVVKGDIINGDSTFLGTYGMEDIPYFIKAGSIIPTYSNIMNLKARPDTLLLKVIPGADSHIDYYEDANDDNTYQDGQFTLTPILKKETAGTIALTIKPRIGKFAGMPVKRTYIAHFMAQKQPLLVKINGKVASSNWDYDANKRIVSVTLPDATFTKTYKVEIKR